MTLFVYQKIAKNIGCNHICSYSDSKTTIDIATKPVNKYHCYVFGIASAQELLRMDGEVQLCRYLREGNTSDDMFKI